MSKMPDSWKLVLNEIIVKILVKYTGAKLWLLTKILSLGGQYVYDWYIGQVDKAKRASIQADAKKEYDKVINDPTKTVDDRGKAYENYINAGRKP